MAKLNLQLVTPERTVLNAELGSLSCPTTDGQITILPGHTPLIATLTNGELIGRNGGADEYIHVAGGFVQVRPGNKVIILADTAEHYYEIDIARAEQAKAEAEKTLKEQKLSNEEYAATAAMLQKSLSRISIARKHANRRHTPITNDSVFRE